MHDILIFKTDRIGDLVNISPIIFNIKKNNPNCNIHLVCSEYNYSLAKYYKDLVNLIVFKKPFIKFLILNFNLFFKKKFDMILQLDGKNHSYLSSIFIRSPNKNCIRYIKRKSIIGFRHFATRPSFPINKFFNHLEDCYEDYDISNNKSYHYLTLYLNILKKNSFKIFSPKHFLPINKESFLSNNNGYILFHIDERWNKFDANILKLLSSKIEFLSKNHKILLTTNSNGNDFFNNLIKKIESLNNVNFIKKSTIDDLIKLIYNSKTVISSHTGLIVHIAACFDKKIIDLVPNNIFNELDRWVPIRSNYHRFDLNNLDNVNF